MSPLSLENLVAGAPARLHFDEYAQTSQTREIVTSRPRHIGMRDDRRVLSLVGADQGSILVTPDTPAQLKVNLARLWEVATASEAWQRFDPADDVFDIALEVELRVRDTATTGDTPVPVRIEFSLRIAEAEDVANISLEVLLEPFVRPPTGMRPREEALLGMDIKLDNSRPFTAYNLPTMKISSNGPDLAPYRLTYGAQSSTQSQGPRLVLPRFLIGHTPSRFVLYGQIPPALDGAAGPDRCVLNFEAGSQTQTVSLMLASPSDNDVLAIYPRSTKPKEEWPDYLDLVTLNAEPVEHVLDPLTLYGDVEQHIPFAFRLWSNTGVFVQAQMLIRESGRPRELDTIPLEVPSGSSSLAADNLRIPTRRLIEMDGQAQQLEARLQVITEVGDVQSQVTLVRPLNFVAERPAVTLVVDLGSSATTAAIIPKGQSVYAMIEFADGFDGTSSEMIDSTIGVGAEAFLPLFEQDPFVKGLWLQYKTETIDAVELAVRLCEHLESKQLILAPFRPLSRMAELASDVRFDVKSRLIHSSDIDDLDLVADMLAELGRRYLQPQLGKHLGVELKDAPVELIFTHPNRFFRRQVRSYDQAARRLAKRLGQGRRSQIKFASESDAASVTQLRVCAEELALGAQDQIDHAICIDVGGGTTDVSVTNVVFAHGRLQQFGVVRRCGAGLGGDMIDIFLSLAVHQTLSHVERQLRSADVKATYAFPLFSEADDRMSRRSAIVAFQQALIAAKHALTEQCLAYCSENNIPYEWPRHIELEVQLGTVGAPGVLQIEPGSEVRTQSIRPGVVLRISDADEICLALGREAVVSGRFAEFLKFIAVSMPGECARDIDCQAVVVTGRGALFPPVCELIRGFCERGGYRLLNKIDHSLDVDALKTAVVRGAVAVAEKSADVQEPVRDLQIVLLELEAAAINKVLRVIPRAQWSTVQPRTGDLNHNYQVAAVTTVDAGYLSSTWGAFTILPITAVVTMDELHFEDDALVLRMDDATLTVWSGDQQLQPSGSERLAISPLRIHSSQILVEPETLKNTLTGLLGADFEGMGS